MRLVSEQQGPNRKIFTVKPVIRTLENKVTYIIHTLTVPNAALSCQPTGRLWLVHNTQVPLHTYIL